MTNAILPEIILSNDNKNYFVVDNTNHFSFNADEHPPFSPHDIVTSLFNMNSLILFVGFLILYYIFFYGLGKLLGEGVSTELLKTRSINLTSLIILIIGFIYFYYSLPTINQQHFFTYLLVLFKLEMNDINMIGIMILVLIAFYVFTWVMGFPMGKDTKPLALEIIEFKSWIYLIMLAVIMFFIYVLHIEIVDYVYQKGYEWWNGLQNLTKPKPAPSHKPPTPIAKPPSKSPVSNVPINTKKNEVFNVGNNLYTYDDAQAICKVYDARLATYDEVEESYNDGAEWCNYGWSADQMILFPTQKSTWKELQKNPDRKHSCGRPGINGGHMPNPYVKFGVNCYGKKPDPNNQSKAMFEEANTPQSVPKTPEKSDPLVEYWKTQMDNMLLNSFSKKEWSEFSNVH